MNDVICQRNAQSMEALSHALSGKGPDFDKVQSLFATDDCYWHSRPFPLMCLAPRQSWLTSNNSWPSVVISNVHRPTQ